MKKILCFAVAAMMMTGCGMMSSTTPSTASNAPQANTPAPAAANATNAMGAGQGAGKALMQLYNQYKADGNKYDYSNMQNVLNTMTLIANCEGLKTNYKDRAYLTDFGKGMIASSLGLVTQNNVETVTGSLVQMLKSNENVQTATSQAQSSANAAAQYANTAAQYAGALGTLFSAFGK